MKILRAALAVSALLSVAAMVSPAQAAIVTYDWTLSSGSTAAQGGFVFTGSGTLTVDTSNTITDNGFTGDLVTGVTGTLTGGGSVGLPPPTAFTGFFKPDDYFFPAGTSLVQASTNSNSFTAGIGFSTPSGNFILISSDAEGTPPTGNSYSELPAAGGTDGVGHFTATLAPVPLPASVWMMILGLGGLGSVGLRAKKQAKAA